MNENRLFLEWVLRKFEGKATSHEELVMLLYPVFIQPDDVRLTEFKNYLTSRKLTNDGTLTELEAKYAAQKQREQDQILLEQAKIDEILTPRP